ERKRAIHNIEENERQYRLLAENMDDILWTMDINGCLTYVSPSVAKWRGYTSEETVAQTLEGILAPDSLEIANRGFEEAMIEIKSALREPFEPRTIEEKIICKDGSTIWVETRIGLLPDANGLPAGFLGVSRNITERKRAEEALRASEEKFRNLVENAPVSMSVVTPGSERTEPNRATLEMYGYDSKEDFRRKLSIERYDDPQDRERWRALADKGPVKNFEVRLKRKDGTVFWASRSSMPIVTEKVKQRIIVTQDITERKHAEEATKASEKRLRDLVENLPVGVSITASDGHSVIRNRAVHLMYGYDSKEEFRRVPVSAHYHDIEDRKRLLKIIEEHGMTRGYEIRLKRKDGSLLWGSITVIPNMTESGERQYITVTQDITEKKHAEEELQLKAQLLDAVIDSVFLRDFDAGPHAKFLYVNEAACRSFGYIRDEFMQMSGKDLSRRSPEVTAAARKQIEEIGELTIESAYYCKDGRTIPVERHSTIINMEGRRYILSVVRDISERKRAEEELQLKAQLLDAAIDSIFLRDVEPGSKFIYVNGAACRSHGYTKDEFLQMTLRDLSRSTPEVAAAIRKQIEETGEITFETVHHCKDGRTVPVERHSSIINMDGRRYILSVVRDISERKRAEEELQLKAQLLDAVIDSVFLRDLDAGQGSKFIYVNEAACRSFGYTREEFLRMRMRDLAHSSPEVAAARRKQIEETGEVTFEAVHHCKDGGTIPVERHSNVINVEGRRYILSVVRDITERKKAEEDQQLKAQLLDVAIDFIFLRDFDAGPGSKFIYVNETACKSHGYTKEEFMKMGMRDLSHDSSDLAAARRKQLEESRETIYESVHHCKDGGTIPVERHSNVIRLGGKRYILTVACDISERKKAEEELRSLPRRLVEAQENERRAISRELHDQTGQYLTALKLLLGKAERQAPPKVAASIGEAINVANELLAQVRELSLNLRPPMLDDLGLLAAMLWHFERYTARTQVKVRFRHAGLGIHFASEVSTAAYRIVQEALTNVARHAHVKEVAVRVWVDKDRLFLRVEDKGLGFDPVRVDMGDSSGLNGMRERALMLGGSLNIDSAPGAGTTMTAELPLLRNENHRADG
ncbi:MAG: PAS domain S-box protein, partial [Chloroflexota bacterium]